MLIPSSFLLGHTALLLPPKRLRFHSCHSHKRRTSPCQHRCRHGRLSFGSESTLSPQKGGGWLRRKGPISSRGRCLPICSRGVGPITWWRAGRLPGRWHPRRGRRGGRRLWLRRWRSPGRLRPLTRKRGTPKGGSPHPGSLVGAGVAEVPDHIFIDGPGHRAPQYVTAKANLLEGVLGLLLLLWRVGLPLVWVPFEALAAVSLFHVRRRGVAAHPQDVV